MHYIPHTDEEIQEMLSFLGINSIDELFSVIPQALRFAGGLDIRTGLSEFDAYSEVESLAKKNRTDLICFAGGGAYDHEIPSAVKRLANRTEFVTAYTPYQPEVAQGVLQALFEYQTFIARLSGLEVANASLYDGATALVEAINMATDASSARVLISSGVNPNYRQVINTMANGTHHDICEVSLKDGTTNWNFSETNASTVVVQYPNYFGCLEDVTTARELATKLGAKLVVVYDPVAIGITKTPGELGADIAVAEGQPFGTPLGFGGPYVGLFSCKTQDVRKLPGRLVGQTVDADGKDAYVTTLRTREQDIRREKATSNVCTNQTLIAVTTAIQLSWLGTAGLREMALQCARGTRYLRNGLLNISGVEPAFSAPVVREFTLKTPVKSKELIERMTSQGFLAGLPATEIDENAILISVTEKRTKQEIDGYIAAFEKAVSE